jgi:hypothetical protein
MYFWVKVRDSKFHSPNVERRASAGQRPVLGPPRRRLHGLPKTITGTCVSRPMTNPRGQSEISMVAPPNSERVATLLISVEKDPLVGSLKRGRSKRNLQQSKRQQRKSCPG